MALWILFQSLWRTLFSPRIKDAVPEEYRDAIIRLAKKRKNQRFLNGTNNQGLLVAGEMLTKAGESEEVLIYSKALEPTFYADILRNSRCKIKIILNDEKGVGVIKSLPSEVQARLEYHVAESKEENHFLVTQSALRYEIVGNSNELYVICNFYEPATAQRLQHRFNDLWESSSSCAQAA